MRIFLQSSVILLLVSILWFNSVAQDSSNPVFRFIIDSEKLPHSDVRDIDKLTFEAENYASTKISEWTNKCKDFTFVKSVNISATEQQNITKGELILMKPNSLSDVRKLLESMNIEVFYINNTKILTKNVLNREETQKKAMEYVYDNYVFKKECNDTTLLDYYDFQVSYLKAKIHYMWTNNYVKYLFDGTVTKYTENLDKMILRRENFIKLNK